MDDVLILPSLDGNKLSSLAGAQPFNYEIHSFIAKILNQILYFPRIPTLRMDKYLLSPGSRYCFLYQKEDFFKLEPLEESKYLAISETTNNLRKNIPNFIFIYGWHEGKVFKENIKSSSSWELFTKSKKTTRGEFLHIITQLYYSLSFLLLTGTQIKIEGDVYVKQLPQPFSVLYPGNQEKSTPPIYIATNLLVLIDLNVEKGKNLSVMLEDSFKTVKINNPKAYPEGNVWELVRSYRGDLMNQKVPLWLCRDNCVKEKELFSTGNFVLNDFIDVYDLLVIPEARNLVLNCNIEACVKNGENFIRTKPQDRIDIFKQMMIEIYKYFPGNRRVLSLI